MLTAFQVNHQYSSIDSFAVCHTVPGTGITREVGCDAVVALCDAGLWPAAIFAAGLLNIIVLSAAAAIYRPAGARAAAAILSDPGKNYHTTVLLALMTSRSCTCRRWRVYMVYVLPLGTLFPFHLSFSFLFSFLLIPLLNVSLLVVRRFF